MPKRVGKVSLKLKWKIEDSKIYHANVFQTFFTPYSCVFYIGFINPELMLPKKAEKKEDVNEINLLARYSLDMEAFLRLKNEVDKTYRKLKEMGALKDVK